MTANVTLIPCHQNPCVAAVETPASTHSYFGRLMQETLDPPASVERDTPAAAVSYLPYLDYPVFYFRKALRHGAQQGQKRRDKQ